MQDRKFSKNKFMSYGINGGIAGALVCTIIMLIGNHFSLIVSLFRSNDSIILDLIVNLFVSIILGIIIALLLFWLASSNLINIDNPFEVMILGFIFGFLIYALEQIIILNWILGISINSLISELSNLDINAWFEFLDYSIFGIVVAIVVWSIYEKEIKGLSIKQFKLLFS